MAVQDDRRELEQLELFQIDRPEMHNRSGTDGILVIGDAIVEFELKSTTKESVTTVRDFGMDHIRKWENKHWLIGFYTPKGNALKYTRYASPEMIKPWIQEKEIYIAVDYKLADFAAENLTLNNMYDIIGRKSAYSLDDAKRLHKMQLTVEKYQDLFDIESGYSPLRMLEILKMRCSYIIKRGSTLNNPHIPSNILQTFPKITDNHSAELRGLVAEALDKS